MSINFAAANMAGYNNPGTEIITLVKDGSGNFINPPSYDKIRAYLRSGEVPMLFVTDEGGETGSLYQLDEYSETENKIRFSNSAEAIEFCAGCETPVVSDVGADNVYVIKRITNLATGDVELQGNYAGALSAWQIGKSIQFADVSLIDGKEFVRSNSFSYCHSPAFSNFKFVGYSGSNFITYTLTESGITSTGNDTHLESLYIEGADGLFLKSSGEANKTFRVRVSDTGELSTAEIT